MNRKLSKMSTSPRSSTLSGRSRSSKKLKTTKSRNGFNSTRRDTQVSSHVRNMRNIWKLNDSTTFDHRSDLHLPARRVTKQTTAVHMIPVVGRKRSRKRSSSRKRLAQTRSVDSLSSAGKGRNQDLERLLQRDDSIQSLNNTDEIFNNANSRRLPSLDQ